MIVPPPGIPKRPGPLFMVTSHDAGWGKHFAMLSYLEAAQRAGLKVQFISFDPKG